MEYVIVAFRSRSETVKFNAYLQKNGISSQLVNTPKEAQVGCGLSIKISKSSFYIVKNAVKFAVNNGGFRTFAGFFLVFIKNGKKAVKSI